MSAEPEALRLAEVLENISPSYLHDEQTDTAARLLREQHAEIERLRTENTMIVLENERLMRQIHDAAIRARGER